MSALYDAVKDLLDVATGHRNMTQEDADAHLDALAQEDGTAAPSEPEPAPEDPAQPQVPPDAPAAPEGAQPAAPEPDPGPVPEDPAPAPYTQGEYLPGGGGPVG